MERARVSLIAARSANAKAADFKKILKGFGG